MPVVSHKLQLHYTQFPRAIDSTKDGKTWVFDQQLEEKKCDFFLPLLHKQDCIRLEFEVLQTQLSGLINSEKDISLHENKLVTALMLAETLQYQYCHFFVVKHEAIYFQEQAKSLRAMLKHIGYVFPESNAADPTLLTDWRVSPVVNKQTNNFNVVRQFVQRSRRLLIELDRAFNTTADLSLVNKVDHVALPIINYLALLLFLPRTATNLWIVGTHVLHTNWMKEKEKQLGWENRITLQLKKRGFQLADDLVWCVVNISICFIFVGPLSHWVMPMLMFQQTSEVFSRVAKMIVEVAPLIKLRNHYISILEKNDIENSEKQQVRDYLTHLDKRIDYEIKKLVLGVVNSSTMLVLMLLTISTLSLQPVSPLVGAALIVAATALFYVLNHQMLKNHPNKPPSLGDKVSQTSFFSSNDQKNLVGDDEILNTSLQGDK